MSKEFFIQNTIDSDFITTTVRELQNLRSRQLVIQQPAKRKLCTAANKGLTADAAIKYGKGYLLKKTMNFPDLGVKKYYGVRISD